MLFIFCDNMIEIDNILQVDMKINICLVVLKLLLVASERQLPGAQPTTRIQGPRQERGNRMVPDFKSFNHPAGKVTD